MAGSSSLEIAGVDAGYGAVRVLEGVSLSVPAGETVVLLGTNGNGKTTLMRSIMGQIRPTAGSIRAAIDGTTVDVVGLSPERDLLEVVVAPGDPPVVLHAMRLRPANYRWLAC